VDILNTDIAYQLALSEVETLGPHLQARLIDLFGSAQNIFATSETKLQETRLLKPNQISQLKQPIVISQYQTRISHLAQQDIQIVSFKDPDYPQRLLQIASFPILLYYRGDLNSLSKQNLLAIVGTRKMTAYGKKVVSELLPSLIQKGIVIVSGLAFGVDAHSHRACLHSGGTTVAVQAQGVDQGYPRGNQKLYEQIIQEGGCVISEFPFLENETVEKFHFPRRNRLISGLSDGVLIVEAGEKSGALITARFALDQNRDVFAVPGDIYQHLSRGCLKLIRQGAKVITSAEDILEDFGFSMGKEEPQSELPLMETRIPTDHFETNLEKEIFSFCRQSPQTIDRIVENVSEPASFVSATITKMQLMGKLKEMDGRKFVSIDSSS